MLTRHQAKNNLKKLGISQRKVAPMLGVTFEHLNRCLNGHRRSMRLLRDIASLSSRLPLAK